MTKTNSLDFDPEAVVALNRLLKAVPFDIVISSTWRHGRSLESLQELLMLQGIVPGRVVDFTPRAGELDVLELYDTDGENDYRGFEIVAWLRARPDVRDYVVIDDDKDMMGLEPTRVFQTDGEIGITETCVDRISTFMETSRG